MTQPASPTRVLLIDDDEMSRELLAALLEAKGYAVTVADSADAALASLQSGPRPGVILTDMQMPGSKPEQLAGRLRRACGRNTLLLAMSGSYPPADIIARFDAFLLKPFSATDVEAAIAHRGTAPDPTRKSAAQSRKPAKPAAPSPATAEPHPAVLQTLAASAAAPASNIIMNAAQVPSSQSGPTPAEPPILDETIYRQLAGAMPAGQLHEMYTMCLTDARSRIASMRAHAAAHDVTQFSRQAHAIKGSCGMLGAAQLHRIAAELEQHGFEAGSVNSLDELSHACDRLERMLGARA